MMKFIKRYWYVWVLIFVLSVALNFYLMSDSNKLEDINNRLEQLNSELDRDLNESRVREEAFLEQIKEKNKVIAELDKTLAESMQKYERLKIEMAAVQTPEDPETFKELTDCKQKYGKLSQDLQLSMAFGKETENSLTLCRDKSVKQWEIIILQEQAYIECQEQGKLKDEKFKNLRDSMKDLDRFYKKKFLKRGILKYAVGAAVGIAAGYFIFKKR